MPLTGGGNMSSLPWALSVKGPQTVLNFVQMRSSSYHLHPRLASLRGVLHCIVELKCFFTSRLTQISNWCTPYLTSLLHSLLDRAPVNCTFLKLLNEDGNLQVCMYCMHAWKEDSEDPRTHFRVCKISKFPGGMPPTSPHAIYIMGPTFHICPRPPQSCRC